MILNEIYHWASGKTLPQGYQDVGDDNSKPQLRNLRKSRLTLKQLNKLRMMNDVRKFEYKEKLKDVKKQYSPPAQPMM
jgi:hypothetical protein